eukprot:TRINITY_DN3742_c0_g1_i2.p1 TRINITY_DN3742_c0_g1~~TRINITY_DN3742_c0_g1_i2.p1  ORF type:complete len:279 (-),score=73.20 TRINITY_DN3742_c0_g1_i2:165-1001(-)
MASTVPHYQPPASREEPFEAPSWATPPSEKQTMYLEIAQGGDIIDCIKLKSRAFWVIGRPDKAQITTLHDSISRQHAALVHHRDGRWFLIDLKSAFGTSVRGQKINAYTPEQIGENEHVTFGKADRVYTLRSGEIPEEFQDEAVRAAKKKRADDADAGHPAPKRQKVQQVQASHILVKHNGSRNPSSWRQAHITRTKEEAAAIVAGYRNEIMTGMKTFEEIAREFSDCSSAKRGGDLGPFGPGQMQKEFEEPAFALQVGEISDLVYSASGVHIIKRTA